MDQDINLDKVITQVAQEKGLPKEVLVDTIKQAVLAAARREFEGHEIEAEYDEDNGRVDLYQVLMVVAEVEDRARELSRDEAVRAGLEAEVGDELLFQIFYLDADRKRAEQQARDYPEIAEQLKLKLSGFGRIAAQAAKQVIIQRVREAERDHHYERYKQYFGEIVSGTVRRFERRFRRDMERDVRGGVGAAERGAVIVEVELGGEMVEAMLPERDQIPREPLRPLDKIRAYVKDIDRSGRGPLIILSRTHPGFVQKLFSEVVPEIHEDVVRIEGCVRDPGSRTKIAVSSTNRDVDPVGACVGMRGARVQQVVRELGGMEKIDIVPWDPDAARFVCNAIRPARVSRVLIDADRHAMELVVPDDNLSLAIGKRGQNVRLASKLSGWRLDIHSESKVADMEYQALAEIAHCPGVNAELAATLFELGWRSLRDLALADAEELAGVEGVGSEERAEEIIDFANDAASGKITVTVPPRPSATPDDVDADADA